MVFSNWLNGVHVAYVITSSSKQHDLEPWMKTLTKKLASVQLDWAPNAFITDCVQAEIGGLQYVWHGVKIFLCLWHVCCAWLKKVVAKNKDYTIRVGVLKGLGRIIYNTKRPRGDGMGPTLRDSLSIVSNLWAYFDKQWADKTHFWLVGHRNLPYVGHNTYAAIERYHSYPKVVLCVSKGRAHKCRLDWVIYKSTEEILSH